MEKDIATGQSCVKAYFMVALYKKKTLYWLYGIWNDFKVVTISQIDFNLHTI